jgi:hypothetical protein
MPTDKKRSRFARNGTLSILVVPSLTSEPKSADEHEHPAVDFYAGRDVPTIATKKPLPTKKKER